MCPPAEHVLESFLDGSLTHYSTKDGLANGSVWGIWADDDGTMWFNTFSGTSHFDPAKLGWKKEKTYPDETAGINKVLLTKNLS